MDEEEKNLAIMLTSISNMRGMVISRVATLEMLMNLFLVRHFCKTEELQNELLETVFATSKYTFDSKRDTILAIIKKEPYKEYYEANKETFNYLQDIAKERNVFAHYPIDGSENGMQLFNNGITPFWKFKNSSTIKTYTEPEIRSLENKLTKTCNFFMEITDRHQLSTPDIKAQP